MKKCKTFLGFGFLFLMVTLCSTPSYGQWGKALHFSWWQHDRVVIPDAPSLFPFVLNAGTIEMWFKPDSLFTATSHAPDYTYLFSKNLSGNVQGDVGIGWKRDDGDIQCFIQDGTITQDVYPLIKAWEPRWYHIAYVWDTNDSMRVFIDGVQSADIEPNSAGELCLPVYGGTQQIVIGSGSVDLLDQRYETFRGSIDEVRISAISRYKSNFKVPTAPYEPDAYTVALWHFDEGSGKNTTDATGNGFNGVLGKVDSAYAEPEWISVVRDPKIVINEVNVDPADGGAGDANGDGTRDALADQFVELVNVTNADQDLSGWKLGDNSGLNFTFPQGYVIKPGTFVTVFGGGDVSKIEGYNADQTKTRVFTAGGSIGDGLALTGDYVILKSADGNHDTYLAYGDKYAAGAPAGAGASGIAWEFMDKTQAVVNNDNSITRSPDGTFQEGDVYVQHKTVSSAAFSPNKTAAGFASLTFPLVVNIVPAAGGTVTIDPQMNSYPAGTVVKLTATPADKYVFTGWSGDSKEVVNPITFTVNGPKTINLNFSPQFKVTPRLVVNECLADPKNDPILGDANGDGVVSSSQDEFVEFANVSNEPFDLSGFKFGDDEMITFTFPNGYIVPPKGLVTIFGGGNVQKVPGYNSDPLKTKVFLADSVGVGNGLANGGDFVILLSPKGDYDLYFGYNSKFNSGPPTTDVVKGVDFEIMQETAANGQDDNSMTMYPDGNIKVGDPFVEHKTVSEKLFSPGQTVDGQGALAVKDNTEGKIPENFSLSKNYPNPFNPSTTINFEIPVRAKVALKIYSILGKEIATLVNQEYAPGSYHAVWNGRSANGGPVTSGVYIYRLITDKFSQSGKMMLLK
jgi:hypothetical protein